EEAYGDSDDWPGHKVKIYCVKTQYAGKTVDGLRIQPIIPKPAKPAQKADESEFDDEVPLMLGNLGRRIDTPAASSFREFSNAIAQIRSIRSSASAPTRTVAHRRCGATR